MTEPVGRPLIEVLGEIVEDNPDIESLSLLDLSVMREAQASRSLDGQTQSLPPVPEDMYPADAVALDATMVGHYEPPSRTVLNTVGRESFYVVESLEEILQRVGEAKQNGDDFAVIFDLAPQGLGSARRVLVPWQAVGSIIDLSDEAATLEP